MSDQRGSDGTRSLQLAAFDTPYLVIYDDTSSEEVWDHTIFSNLGMMQKQSLDNKRAYGKTRFFNILELVV